MNGKTILKGTVILTAAGIVVKLMGFVYRVYMTRLIGAEGMGLYQLIIPLYMLAYSFTSAGLTTAISKVTSAEIGRKCLKSGYITALYGSIIGVSLAFFIGVIGFFFSDTIAANIIGEPLTSMSVKILSVSFPFMAASSCMRGVFYGSGKTEVPAASQIIEQGTRIAAIFIIGKTFVSKGLDYACCAAALGMSAGEIVSFLFVSAAYIFSAFRHKKESSSQHRKLLHALVHTAIPLTASRTVSSALSALENMLIPAGLVAYGLSGSESLEVFGRITGMVIPLVMFPSAFLMALSTSVMPAISERWASGNRSAVKHAAEKTIVIAISIGIFSLFLFSVFPKELGMLIYSDSSISFYTRLTALLCPLIYIQSAFAAILNGLSEQRFIFISGLISSGIMIFFTYFIVPLAGIIAFYGGWLSSLAISSFMSLHRIQKRADIYIDIKGAAAGILKGIASFLPAKVMFDVLGSIVSQTLCLAIAVIVAALLFSLMNINLLSDIVSLKGGYKNKHSFI